MFTHSDINNLIKYRSSLSSNYILTRFPIILGPSWLWS